MIAQAQVDSTGLSTAYAAHPYPSSIVVGQLGSNYPFYASSAYPATPKASVDEPVSHLSATSSELESAASASGSPSVPGVAVAGSSSTARVLTTADGAVTSTADTLVEGFSVAGVLSIASVRSHASVVRDAAGHVTRKSSISIGAATVAGQTVEITDRGVEAAGQIVPLSSDAVTAPLEQAGITVKLISASQTATQASAPALRIAFAGNVPNVGYVQSFVLLGFSSASLSAKGELPPATVPSATAVPPASAGQPTTSSPVLAGVGVAQGRSDTTQVVPPPAVGAGSGGTKAVLVAATSLRQPYSWISLYVMAVAGAAVVFAGAQLVRFLGVRAR